MKQLCIIVLSLLIYYNAFSPLSISDVKKESSLVYISKSSLNKNQDNSELLSSKVFHSINFCPENILITRTDTIIQEQPLISPVTDTIGLIQNENISPPPDTTGNKSFEINNVLDDTTKLIPNETLISPGDSMEVIRNDSLMIPLDSTGLIQPIQLIPGDTSRLLLKDSINNKVNLQKDTVPRIQFRSVYVDSIEQGNPNFFAKKVLEIKWITEKRDTAIRYKNVMGFNLFYGVYTYGLGFGIFKRLSNDADFIANVNLSYVFDRRTVEDIDSTGDITALNKESRMYPIVFNVGLEKYFMQNRIDWKIKPILIFGFAPAFIPVTPYELTFFKSLKKLQISYGLGVYAALGFDWQAFQRFGINLTARYSFIPIIAGKEIYYYKGFLVKNIGGFYVNLGVTILKEYFSKN